MQPRHQRPRPGAPRALALFMTALFLVSAFAPLTSAYTPNTDADGDDLEPNPRLEGNVSISNHKAACANDVLCYFTDTDEQANLRDDGFVLNDATVDEPIRFYPSRVDHQYYGEDPDDKSMTTGWAGNISDKAWLDTGNWAASGGEGNETFARVFYKGAHALHIKNPGSNPGSIESDTWTMDFSDLTSDVSKLRLHIGVEIVREGITTDDTNFFVHIVDANGTGYDTFDYRASATHKVDGSIPQYLANGTGTTYWDRLISDGRNTLGGVHGDIGKITIGVKADAGNGPTEVYLWALAVSTKRNTFGIDTDGDPVYNMTYQGKATPPGYVDLHTFAPSFEYQNVKDLRVSYAVEAASLDDDNVRVLLSDLKDDPNYARKHNYRMTYELPEQIDLSYADGKVWYTLPVDGSQHDLIRVDGTDKTKTFEDDDAGDLVKLLDPAPTDKQFEVEFTILYTDAQWQQMSALTGPFAFLADDHPANTFVVALAGIAGIGLLFAGLTRTVRKKGVRRKFR